jgi:hypothetical protein
MNYGCFEGKEAICGFGECYNLIQMYTPLFYKNKQNENYIMMTDSINYRLLLFVGFRVQN